MATRSTSPVEASHVIICEIPEHRIRGYNSSKFRTLEETAERDPAKLPGFGYQIYMAQNLAVYEVDCPQLEKYRVQLTSLLSFMKTREAGRHWRYTFDV